MKRNFDSLILGLDGKAMKDGSPSFKYLTNDAGEVVYSPSGPLLKMDGKTFKPVVHEEAKNMTVGAVALSLVRGMIEGDDKAIGQVKLERFKLAEKIIQGGVADLGADDVKMLKDRADKALQDVVVYARFIGWLEADPLPEAQEAQPQAAPAAQE